MQHITKADQTDFVHDAVVWAEDPDQPEEQHIQVALHRIDRDVVEIIEDITDQDCIMTIVNPDSRHLYALAYMPRAQAGVLVEETIRRITRLCNAVFDFCQGAPVTDSCAAYLGKQGATWAERLVPASPRWQPNGILRGLAVSTYLSTADGQADEYSVTVARQLMENAREDREYQRARSDLD